MTPTRTVRCRNRFHTPSGAPVEPWEALLQVLPYTPQRESLEERTGVEPLRSKGHKGVLSGNSCTSPRLLPSASTRAPLVTSGSADDELGRPVKAYTSFWACATHVSGVGNPPPLRAIAFHAGSLVLAPQWTRSESNRGPPESSGQLFTCVAGLLLERVEPADSAFNVEGLVTDRPTDSVFVRVIAPRLVTRTPYQGDVPQAAAWRAGAFAGKSCTTLPFVHWWLLLVATIQCTHCPLSHLPSKPFGPRLHRVLQAGERLTDR